MPYDPNKHHRRSIRLRGYDYTRRGAYFVTICTHRRECLFGEVAGAEMRLNAYGRIVAECWEAIPAHFDRVELDAFVAMPNHVHAIVVFTTDDVLSQRPVAPSGRPKGPQRHSLGAVVGAFKAAASKRINELRGTAGAPVWLRNYYEQIVRDEADLARIRAYIERNPPLAQDVDSYLAKYRADIEAIGMTPETLSATFTVLLRAVPTKLRGM